MWAALRSDIKEFVSTVSSEGTHALSALDDKLKSLDDNDNENEGSEEYDQDQDRDIPSATVLDGEVFGDGFETTGIIATAADEAARLAALEETYTEELPDTVRFGDFFVIIL